MHVRGSNQAQIRPTCYLDYPHEVRENTSFGSGAPCAHWRMSWLTCTPLLVFCAGASRRSLRNPGVPMHWGLCSSPTDCKSICTPGVPMLWGLCSSPTDCKSGVCPRSLRICNTTWGGVAKWLPLAPVGIPASGV